MAYLGGNFFFLPAFEQEEKPLESMSDEMVDGNYGSFAFRTDKDRSLWKCHDSSDYMFYGIVDDFGRIQQVGQAVNMRGY